MKEDRLKILVVSQYFYPENVRITDYCLSLKKRGHEVYVLTAKPNYPEGKYYPGYGWFSKKKEYWNGINIYRANLFLRGDSGGVRLFLNYFSFVLFASLRILFIKKKIDKIFIFASSPITIGIPGFLAARKFNAKSFLWIQDLWPESVKDAGGITNKWILGAVDKMTRFIYSQVNVLLVQSKAFIPYLKNQDVDEDKIIYYPFYAESFFGMSKPKSKYLKKLPKGFKLLFAGNIGKAQSFQTLLDAAEILKAQNYPISWIILGDGRMKTKVEIQISRKGLQDVFLLKGNYPSEEMPEYFCCVDGLIISLKKSKIFSMTIPSKLQSYLASGRPIIGSIDGIAANIIKLSEAGFVGGAESVEDLVNSIKRLYNLSSEERLLMGTNARKYFEKEFEKEKLLNRLEVILNS